MITLKEQKETKALKEHKCNFCGEVIYKGDTYLKSTHKYDDVYDWKAHIHCNDLAVRLKMYENANEEGLTQDDFVESIHNEHDKLLIGLIPDEEKEKYKDIIQQIPSIRFKDKLGYVIRYYIKLDKKNKNEKS